MTNTPLNGGSSPAETQQTVSAVAAKQSTTFVTPDTSADAIRLRCSNDLVLRASL